MLAVTVLLVLLRTVSQGTDPARAVWWGSKACRAGHTWQASAQCRAALRARPACPSRRVTLSDAYRRWEVANPDAVECWFNTSSVHPESFVWGAAFRFAARFRTADFRQPETYTAFEQYAPCFYYGCAEACLPDQRDFNARLLRRLLWCHIPTYRTRTNSSKHRGDSQR